MKSVTGQKSRTCRVLVTTTFNPDFSLPLSWGLALLCKGVLEPSRKTWRWIVLIQGRGKGVVRGSGNDIILHGMGLALNSKKQQ